MTSSLLFAHSLIARSVILKFSLLGTRCKISSVTRQPENIQHSKYTSTAHFKTQTIRGKRQKEVWNSTCVTCICLQVPCHLCVRQLLVCVSWYRQQKNNTRNDLSRQTRSLLNPSVSIPNSLCLHHKGLDKMAWTCHHSTKAENNNNILFLSQNMNE